MNNAMFYKFSTDWQWKIPTFCLPAVEQQLFCEVQYKTIITSRFITSHYRLAVGKTSSGRWI